MEPAMMAFGGFNLIFNGAASASNYVSTAPHPTLATEQFLALQAGSMMLLADLLLLVVMWTSTEMRTVRLAIMVLTASDIPHWICAAWCLGPLAFHPASWSVDMKAYMGVPVITFLIKVLYLLGWLGGDRIERGGRKEV
jgi:hypothetical protein